MQLRRWLRYSALLTIIIVLVGCAPGKDSYRQGEELRMVGNWEGAVAYYKDALVKEPNNKKYQEALRKAEQEAAKEHYQQALDIWNRTPRKDYRTVAKTMTSLDKAVALDPENPDIVEFHHQLETKKQELAAQAERFYLLGVTALTQEQWLEAVTNFRKAKDIYPNYKNTEDKLASAVTSGCRYYYKKGISAVRNEDWKGALNAFDAVMEINPDYKNTRTLMADARKNDNPKYYLLRAEEMASAKEWDRAVSFYATALTYVPGDPGIQSRLVKAKLRASRYYFDSANRHSKKNLLYRANQEYLKAKGYSPSLSNSSSFKKSLNIQADKLFKRASKYTTNKKYGNGLAWYWQLNQIKPQYPTLLKMIRKSENIIKKRLKKSIAIFDFASPSNNPDAGAIASSNLITYLFNNSNGDIRILERQDLQTVLRKMNLTQGDVVGNMEAARQLSRVSDIDIFIMGNVLLYKTERDESKASKVAKIRVGTQVKDNPEYLLWKAKHPKPTKEQLASAPPAVIEVPEYHYENYTVGRKRMRAVFHIYYKIIDCKKGEIIANDTFKRNKEVVDSWNDGIPEADIPYNPPELPTESELLEQVTAEVVRDLALLVLEPFQSLQTNYFDEAEILMQLRQYEEAIEKYVDAIYDESIKGIETPISKKSMEIIDQLISDL